MLLRTLSASLLRNLLPGKGGIRAGEETDKAEQEFLIPFDPLSNLEIQR